MSETLLKGFKLRSTPNRQEILHLFLKKNHALSHGDIEKEIDNSLDRVTVYRTLKTFLDKGLIHKVLDDEGSLKYALCNEACTTAEHHHDHVHADEKWKEYLFHFFMLFLTCFVVFLQKISC